MTKTQKIIVTVGIVLVFLSIFFPFYWEGQFGEDRKLIRAYLKWGLDPNLRDWLDNSSEMNGYTRRPDLFLLQVAIILVLAAAGFIIARQKRKIEAKRGPIMAQEGIILATALLIVMAILFPPCNKFTLSSKTLKIDKAGTGWAWILDTKEHGDFIWGAYKLGRLDAKYPEIRYDVLGLEIFGILVLAGTGLLITKKQ
jgi:hypothetical protein